MPTSVATLVTRTRNYLRDWGQWQDSLTASLSSSGTTMTVAAGADYKDNWPIEIDQEAILVTADGSGTSVSIKRGVYGSTAASHANSATILVRPQFFTYEIVDAINNGLSLTFPRIYRPVVDTSLSGLADTYEYTVPNLPGTYAGGSIPIPYVARIEIKETGDDAFRAVRAWEVMRAATPKIKFRRVPPRNSTIRVWGFGPFPDVVYTDSLNAQWPVWATDLLVEYAAAQLLASGEARRVRVDVGIVDARENANRVGGSLNAADRLLVRARQRLMEAAMAPLPKHVVSTI